MFRIWGGPTDTGLPDFPHSEEAYTWLEQQYDVTEEEEWLFMLVAANANNALDSMFESAGDGEKNEALEELESIDEMGLLEVVLKKLRSNTVSYPRADTSQGSRKEDGDGGQ